MTFAQPLWVTRHVGVAHLKVFAEGEPGGVARCGLGVVTADRVFVGHHDHEPWMVREGCPEGQHRDQRD